MDRARSRKRNWQRIFLLFAAIATTGVSHAHFDTRSRISRGEILVPSPESARLWSLGFDAVLADYYWLRALGVVGSETGAVEAKGELIASLIEVVTGIDPWVDHPYRFAAVWLTRDADMVRRGNELLKRGISYHPLDWRNRYHLGFNHFFYLEENLAAADVLETAVDLDGAPHYLAPLVARLRSSEGGIQFAGHFLARMAETTDDEFKRAEYLKALDEIQIEERARFLDGAREEYWRRHGRDIERVSDLLAGPDPILDRLPRAQLNLDGFEWVLDEQTGQIMSSFYRSRYELHVTATDRARQKRWRARQEAKEGGGS